MTKHRRTARPPAQKKPPLTHFLCLPLVTPDSKAQLEDSLVRFKDDVISQEPSATIADASRIADETVTPSIHPKAIRPVGALHCTLGVMSLKPEQLDAAVQLLQSLDITSLLRDAIDVPASTANAAATQQPGDGPTSLRRPITPPQIDRTSDAISINLKGLESMHAPERTSILYTAPSDPSDRLYNFCLALQQTFKDRDLLVEDNRQLKLHATLVNTIYAKGRKRPQPTSDRSSGHGPHANAPLKIDATRMLEKYRDFVWADNVVLDRVAICEMGAKKVLDGEGNVVKEEYTEVAAVRLPG